MSIWTDIIDPATLTGFARDQAELYERSRGSLSDYLPDTLVDDVIVRLDAADNGLVEAAKFRAFDAELEKGARKGGSRKTLELPPLGQAIPISEYDRLRIRNADDDAIRQAILRTAQQAVWATSDRMEHMRGIVLATGKATIDQDNLKVEDDFGRDADMSVTAGTLWSDPSSKPLNDLAAFIDAYAEKNGELPGTLLGSQQALRALGAHPTLATSLPGGASRPATTTEVQSLLDGYGVPAMVTYNRRVRIGGKAVEVLPKDRIFLLPQAGASTLGATFWGTTLGATEAEGGILTTERPGIYATVDKQAKAPYRAEVQADAIGLPVLANANLAFTAKVL